MISVPCKKKCKFSTIVVYYITLILSSWEELVVPRKMNVWHIKILKSLQY